MSSKILFQRAASVVGSNDVFDLFLIDDDGSNLLRLTTSLAGKEFDSFDAAFSPTGESIVFATMRHREDAGNENTSEIYRIKKDWGVLTRLTSDGFYDSSPSWSNDGQSILFTGERPDERLFTMSAVDGSSITALPIASGGNGDRSASYSPDGSRIAFIRDFGGGIRSVFVADADGSNEQNLTTIPSLCTSPRWSPDGLRISYASDHHNPITNQLDIYVMDAADSNGDGEGDNRTRLTMDSSSTVSSQSPVFSPDGSQIAYVNNSGGKSDIHLMNADGSNPAVFQSYGEDCFLCDWK
ncbi:TolB family protein [Rubripirellula reticaptiva]|uniref:Translocation protein TolB n=1 Tax=Rubripirellula reticaptiva TaxID=2528013 RepID=A0A5C6EJS7_9BACT|nr:PD40 domain-containing protein [Rubripirellula reticaptiva]TWU49302.1 translocation protein TolB [Rubripirellula reticaptiva]